MINYIEQIRNYMRENSKTQVEMAALLNIPRGTIAGWLTGQKGMSLRHYIKCQEFFGK